MLGLELGKMLGLLEKMENKSFNNLIHGFDTLQCAYYLEWTRKGGIDFEWLIKERESIKQTKSKEPKKISLGESDFLLHPFGSSSGYPIIIANEDFKLEMGEYNNPNFFVTFRSETALAKHRVHTLWFSINMDYFRHGPGAFQVASKTLPAARFLETDLRKAVIATRALEN